MSEKVWRGIQGDASESDNRDPAGTFLRTNNIPTAFVMSGRKQHLILQHAIFCRHLFVIVFYEYLRANHFPKQLE